jgi:hypothetical protein
MRRESYSNRFATALEGVDIDNPGTAFDRSGHLNPMPRVTGKVRRKYPIEVRDVEFLRKNTDRMIKMTTSLAGSCRVTGNVRPRPPPVLLGDYTSLTKLFEVSQIWRLLVLLGGHQKAIGAEHIVLRTDADMLVAFGTNGLDPNRIRHPIIALDH